MEWSLNGTGEIVWDRGKTDSAGIWREQSASKWEVRCDGLHRSAYSVVGESYESI